MGRLIKIERHKRVGVTRVSGPGFHLQLQLNRFGGVRRHSGLLYLGPRAGGSRRIRRWAPLLVLGLHHDGLHREWWHMIEVTFYPPGWLPLKGPSFTVRSLKVWGRWLFVTMHLQFGHQAIYLGYQQDLRWREYHVSLRARLAELFGRIAARLADPSKTLHAEELLIVLGMEDCLCAILETAANRDRGVNQVDEGAGQTPARSAQEQASVRALHNPQRAILRLELPGSAGRDIAREEKDPVFPDARWGIGYDDRKLALILQNIRIDLVYRDEDGRLVVRRYTELD